jgi:hypothetical protein
MLLVEAVFCFARSCFYGDMLDRPPHRVQASATDRAIGVVERFAACCADPQRPSAGQAHHWAVMAQRVFGIALGPVLGQVMPDPE